MDTLVIRPLQEQDLTAIADMIAKLADHIHPGMKPKANADNLLEYGPMGSKMFEGIIALRNESPVGCCLYSYMFSGWRGKPGLFILDLFVEKTERGTGLGKKLLQDVIERESPKGCSMMMLELDKQNTAGRAFYEKLGFKRQEKDDLMLIEIPAFRA
jgi:GNAT superfamily N-acetyltransferase